MNSKQVKASPQFVADFETVAEHYNLKALGEYEEAKEAARKNLDNAITTFANLADQVRKGNT
jgi:hypothetical protein